MDLCKIVQILLSGDFIYISTKSSHKDLYKITQGPRREDFTRISKRSPEKDCARSARTSQRISAGSAQDLATRTCTREDVTRIFTRPLRGFHQDHFVLACAVEMHVGKSQEPVNARIYRKKAAAQDRDARFVAACAVEMHMDICHRGKLMREFTGKETEARWSTLIKQRPLLLP